MVCVSAGTAGVLGLAQVPMLVVPTTAYLMLGGRCSMNCLFCAQARESTASAHALSRVTWPEFRLDQVCARLGEAEQCQTVRRCCVQVTVRANYIDHSLELVRELRQHTALPLSVAVLPRDIRQVASLVNAGVERIGFGLDAACEPVFRQVKGGHWGRMLALIARAAREFPGHVTVHLIVGLGETEQELVERVAWARDLGVGVGLFAFTPVRGTPLGRLPQPSLSRYRRVQVASDLVLRHGAGLGDLRFANAPAERGRLTGIRLTDWRERVADGQAFRTMGCPGCNRPFYNERPVGPLYNYPRAMSESEARTSVLQMEIGPDGAGP